jgi:hypothetical protein
MAICASDCAITAPAGYAYCFITSKKGGLARFAFLACDETFTDITDDAEWQTKINAGTLTLTGQLAGQKPRGTFTRTKLAAGIPDSVTGKENTWSFVDFNVDPLYNAVSPTQRDITFWNTIVQNASKYKVYAIDCENFVHGPVNDFVAEVDLVIPDNTKEFQRYEGSIMWDGIDILTRTALGFNINILTA